MVYVMEFFVDGGCRGNGQPGAIGAAACCLMRKYRGSHQARTIHLPSYPAPTNQRAEIMAIIMALEWAIEKTNELMTNPAISVRIHSDSKYAIGCMNTWIDNWVANGWVNSSGFEVANRDLIERASDLNDEVAYMGSVRYEWVPRSENQLADEYCNDALDDLA
ncbi:ribonuclease H1 [Xylaria palmicola]|nr:ribonuclease H1 [Xylaria palmicola]